MKDPRIVPVNEKIEQTAMERFVENYILGKNEFLIKEQIFDKDTDTHMFTLVSRVSKQTVEVLDWECRCGELGRTGIPCPHLLACAFAV